MIPKWGLNIVCQIVVASIKKNKGILVEVVLTKAFSQYPY
jgi:hypothetical protein